MPVDQRFSAAKAGSKQKPTVPFTPDHDNTQQLPSRIARRPSDMLALQRIVGNQYVQRLLAYLPTNVVRRTVEKQIQRKVKHTTGKEVDTYVNASPFIKKFVEDKVRNGTKADGHVHIHTPEDFVKEFVKYAMNRTNPATGANFTEDEAKNLEPNVNAFRDGTEIRIHQDRGETGTAIHESIHLFSDDSYRAKVGFNANEGSTEFFARMICTEQKITRGDFYVDERKSIEKLVGVSSKESLSGAYFQGKISALEKAVDAKTAGVFAKWISSMNKGKYAEADALL